MSTWPSELLHCGEGADIKQDQETWLCRNHMAEKEIKIQSNIGQLTNRFVFLPFLFILIVIPKIKYMHTLKVLVFLFVGIS